MNKMQKQKEKKAKEDEGKLKRTITFGLGELRGFNPRRNELIELTDAQQKDIYRYLLLCSMKLGQIENVLGSGHYITKTLRKRLPKKLLENPPVKALFSGISDFSNTGARKIFTDIEKVTKKGETKEVTKKTEYTLGPDDIGGGVMNQAWRLGAGPQFAGKHGASLARGEKSIANFRIDGTQQIYCATSCTRLFRAEDKIWLACATFSKTWAKKVGCETGWVAFAVKIEDRDHTLQSWLKKLIDGEWELRSSAISKSPKQTGAKWIGRISHAHYPEKQKKLDPNIIMGVDMGVRMPTCAFILNTVRAEGAEDEILYPAKIKRDWTRQVGKSNHDKQDIAERKRIVYGAILQVRSALRGEHGILTRSEKEQCKRKLSRLRKREKNLVRTASFEVAKILIRLAVQNNAGVIQLENLDLDDLKSGKSKKWIRRHWSPGVLISAIEQQAEEWGVEIRYINPRYTSQRCAKCGYIPVLDRDKPSRKEGSDKFCCPKCKHKDHADRNAAKNIAIPGIGDVIKNYIEKREENEEERKKKTRKAA